MQEMAGILQRKFWNVHISISIDDNSSLLHVMVWWANVREVLRRHVASQVRNELMLT